MVCSPGAIACRRGDRSKTDMHDAFKLARRCVTWFVRVRICAAI